MIPGFDKLSGLITIVAAALGIMWFVDRTRIWMVSFVRFEYVLGIFVVLLNMWNKLLSLAVKVWTMSWWKIEKRIYLDTMCQTEIMPVISKNYRWKILNVTFCVLQINI